MIKIEVTGESIPEVADKLLAIGNSLKQVLHNAAKGEMSTQRAVAAAEIVDEQQVADIVEGAEKKSQATRRKKAAETAPVVEQAVNHEAMEQLTADSVVEMEDAPSKLTYAGDIVPCVLSAVEEHGREALEAILASLGVTKASQLAEDRWPDLLSKIERLG